MSTVIVRQDDHAGIIEGPGDGQRAIGRAIIDEQQLEVGDRLSKYRANRRREEAHLVVEREADRDERSHREAAKPTALNAT